jgi:hypothetical protein
MVFVGSTAFGDINQFENETGLTVDAIMFPDVISERTVEAMGVDFYDFVSHEEFTFAIYKNALEESMTVTQLLGAYDYRASVVEGMVAWDETQYKVGVRLKAPLLSGV